MESYRIEVYYSIDGKQRVLRRNFATLGECRAWVSENGSVEVVSGSGSYRSPITGYRILRLTEEVVEDGR